MNFLKFQIIVALLISFLIFSISCSAASNNGSWICPPAEEISPCNCTLGINPELSCVGDNVTQPAIDHLFKTVRLLNNVPDTVTLQLGTFEMTKTNLTSLNLSFLNGTVLDFLIFFDNNQLQYFDGSFSSKIPPATSQSANLSFSTRILFIDDRGHTIQELADLFKSLNPNQLHRLFLRLNYRLEPLIPKQKEVEIGEEFLNSFSRFENLSTIDLSHNHIRKIEGGNFKSMNDLTILRLNNNPGIEIGQDGFLFDESKKSKYYLRIKLTECELTDDKIDARHGLDVSSGHRPISLDLGNNNFTFISRGNFEKFLLANPKNGIILEGNKLICDEKMRWLRNGKEGFEKRVLGANCKNDEDMTKTVFTTDLLK